MSVTASQEHSCLKVLFDFGYKTADGRDVTIKKNERLFLLQKTNADWWQVVRNPEQRSFYVPATYVREISRGSTRKSSEEDREVSYERPQHPSYKSIPRETSDAMRNVKKWLAGATDGKAESPKNSRDCDGGQRAEDADGGGKGRSKIGFPEVRTESMERDRRSGHFSDRDEDGRNASPRSRDSGEYREHSGKIVNRFGTSPVSHGLQSKIEASLQDPFRRELESSLDRRNLGNKIGSRIRTRSMNSEGSQMDGEGGIVEPVEVRDSSEKSDKASNRTSGNSGSLEHEPKKFSIRKEACVSPKPLYGRQMTIASSSSGPDGPIGDHKILNDKRRTWAVEELMSELTQMCKERGTNRNKPQPVLQLKSTEVKTNFDPIEKLTREIHEMNRMRNESNESSVANETTTSVSGNPSPINVCKISINSDESLLESSKADSKLIEETRETIDDEARESSRHEDSRKSANRGQTDEQVHGSCPKLLKSPKSPKILNEEYNEANILNDCNNSPKESTRPRSSSPSLSPDKQTPCRKLPSSSHGCLNTSLEEPSYSNVRINADKVIKTRPKLKLKIAEPSTELRLTPSLEKLASEIQFLPAKRTSRMSRDASESVNDGHRIYERASKSDDSLERREDRRTRRSSERSCEYPISVGSKREGTYEGDENSIDDNDDPNDSRNRKYAGLKKKSWTLNCSTIPECYRRFRKYQPIADTFQPIDADSMRRKRRSRSLSDLEVKNWEEDGRETTPAAEPMKNKPIPLPRTKIPAFDVRETSDEAREENSWHGNNSYDSSSFSSLEKRLDRRNINDIESSTAIGFKSLLCVSDSGSDNCLQSKELISRSIDCFDRRSCHGSPRKSVSSLNFNQSSKLTRESLSDDQILSSNASSEALHSESEMTGTLDVSSQPSPTSVRTGQDSFECAIDLPPGWKQQYDSEIGQICFLNEQGDKWFSSNDAEGKIYFFEENSNESSWVLPPVGIEKRGSIDADEKNETTQVECSTGEKLKNEKKRDNVVVRDVPMIKGVSAGGDWPHLCAGNNMLVLREGVINRTKITENGKKVRKNWSASYAVLTELFLLFFKDSKTFAMMSPMAKPDISVDLNGALVEPGERASSRKNVYMISTVLGLQVLVQSDNTALATEWFQQIHAAIRKLPSGVKSQGKNLPTTTDVRKISGGKSSTESNPHEDTKKTNKIARSRSMKIKRLDDSLEDLSGSAAERQTKIKAKLRRFFQRRPAVELLVKNGIYKDEPAFGSYLSDVCPTEPPRVPLFVKTCIQVLESNEENMKTDGLYRASGNLSQIQKIRLQVDQYKLDVLAQEEDVHVLAGALKLFFRELKEPLIPSSFFKEAVNASMLKKSSAKIQNFRDIVKALPPPNYDTLQYLLKHLLRVTSYQEFNRMHIPNLAIVFGPTLMWPAEASANMALDFMQQNLVIECLLSEYNKIFK